MAVYKIVFAGPVGSGKTTAIQSLSDIEVVSTEASASDHVHKIKPTTTVAMDYGLMRLANGDQIRLYGTPGQKRFDFMWDILAESALGLVLLIDASAPAPLDDLRTYVGEFRELIDRSAVVVGITHADLGEWDTRRRINDELARLGIIPSAIHADARERAHMATLVRSLIFSIEPFADVSQDAPIVET